jgi:hypothetical protein
MEYLPQMKMELPEYIDVNVPSSVEDGGITTTTTITTPTETTSYIHGRATIYLKIKVNLLLNSVSLQERMNLYTKPYNKRMTKWTMVRIQ